MKLIQQYESGRITSQVVFILCVCRCGNCLLGNPSVQCLKSVGNVEYAVAAMVICWWLMLALLKCVCFLAPVAYFLSYCC